MKLRSSRRVQAGSYLRKRGTRLLTEQSVAAKKYKNDGRVIALKLSRKPVPMAEPLQDIPPRPSGDPVRFLSEQQTRGRMTYVTRCGGCHGWFGQTGLLPDLRRSEPETLENLESILLDGTLVPLGMPSFAGQLNDDEIQDLKAYLQAVRLE